MDDKQPKQPDQSDQLAHTSQQTSPPPEGADKQAPPPSPEETRQELRQAIEGSNEILSQATTILTVFSDTLTLDRAKLTLTKRAFFSTSEVMSIRIEDVLNVTATVGPVFGSVKIVSRVFNNQKPYIINHFWREDALKMKRVIQGYVIALQRGIDCRSLPAKELATMLDKLGEDDHTPAPAA